MVGKADWVPIYNTEDPLTKLSMYELENLGDHGSTLGGTAGTGTYRQQIANMNIIFNFFLWMKICEVQKKDKGSINIFLNLLGDKYIGKTKIMQLLEQTTTKMSNFLRYLNGTGSMYIPPYAVTARRIYDFVAVFGGLRYNRLKESFLSPGISTRYISHSRLSSGEAMKFVINYWNLESAANKDNEILESEHMFHQLLLNKLCAYQNSSDIVGNVFGIKLVALRLTTAARFTE